MRFLHAADVHLDSPLAAVADRGGDLADAFVGATRRALTNLVDLALTERVDFVLFAGDLWDGDWKDAHAGLFFARQTARLAQAGVPTLIVAGNHDAAAANADKLQWPDNVHFFAARKPETRLLLDGRVAVHGQGFARRDVADNLARGYPARTAGAFNIGLLHTALDGAAGHAPYAPCSVEDLRGKGYDYWALGHVHAARVVARDPWIVYPGNLQGRHVRETGPKGCVLVAADEGGVRAVDWFYVDAARWATTTLDLTGAADWEAALSTLAGRLADVAAQADGRPSAVRVILAGATALDRRLRARPQRTEADVLAVAERVAADLWIERVKIETRPPFAARDGGAASAFSASVDVAARLSADDGAEKAALAQALDAVRAGWPDWLKDAAADFGGDDPDELAAAALARIEDGLDGGRDGEGSGGDAA